MKTITKGVQFDTIAREWRMKWSADNDKASLIALQRVLTDPLQLQEGCESYKVRKLG